MRDTIFNRQQDLVNFCFDEKVVKVFDDMVVRSVPGYKNILESIKLIADTYAIDDSKLYDLGCSTGATSLALQNGQDNTIIAVDNSTHMLEVCEQNLNHLSNVEYICDDIENINISNASVVVLNLTLQFIAKDKRDELIAKIYNGLNSGGVIFISEKIHFEDEVKQKQITDLHLQFKKLNGYTDLEIANKRQMLEDVLITDSEEVHIGRLKSAGFIEPQVILQNLNFYSFLAIK